MDTDASTEDLAQRRLQRLLLSIPDAAETLGIGRSKFYELLATGKVETVKIGKRRLVPSESLAEYVSALRVGGQGAPASGD